MISPIALQFIWHLSDKVTGCLPIICYHPGPQGAPSAHRSHYPTGSNPPRKCLIWKPGSVQCCVKSIDARSPLFGVLASGFEKGLDCSCITVANCPAKIPQVFFFTQAVKSLGSLWVPGSQCTARYQYFSTIGIFKCLASNLCSMCYFFVLVPPNITWSNPQSDLVLHLCQVVCCKGLTPSLADPYVLQPLSPWFFCHAYTDRPSCVMHESNKATVFLVSRPSNLCALCGHQRASALQDLTISHQVKCFMLTTILMIIHNF